MKGEDLAELDGGPLDQPPSSIFAHIEYGLKTNPRGPASIVMHQSPDHLSELTADEGGTTTTTHVDNSSKCLEWTYAQLHRAALRFATGLLAHGVQHGMRIVTLIPNRVEQPLTLWAHAILRLTHIPLDPGAVNPPRREELTKLIDSTNPDIVMVLDDDGAKAIDEVFAGRPSPPKVRVILEGAYNGWTSIPQLAIDGSKSSIDTTKLLKDARAPDDIKRTSVILFTSGTSTGNPKGCPRHFGSINNYFTNTYQWGRGFTPSSRVLTSSANFRIIFVSAHIALWHKGSAAVMPDPSLGAQGTLAAIRQFKLTYILFIPAIMFAVTSSPEFANLDVSSVTDIALGGDMITRDIQARTRASFPNAYVSTAHGMTEGGGIFNWCYYNTPFSQIPFYGEFSPLGTVTPGSKVRIRDPETGATLKRNEAGELCTSSESIIKRYLDHTHQDAFFTSPNDGTRWFRTGDLALINDDGITYILSRIKDVIKRSGIPITPAALESCIEKFTESQTCVVAWPHPVLGQEPLVVVKGLNGKTGEKLRERVLKMFGKDYAVGDVLTLEDLGEREFPLNATGKIMKKDVVEMVERYYGGQQRS